LRTSPPGLQVGGPAFGFEAKKNKEQRAWSNLHRKAQRDDSQGMKKAHYHPNKYFRSRPPKKAMEMLVKVPIK
jgi:hypothetical protein